MVRKFLRALLIILLLPFALTLAYIVIPPVSMLMLADVATLHWPQRDWVSLDRMSPRLIAAVVVSEDGAFCSHFGFDFKQMEKSLDEAKGGGKLRGASTITQQMAKNLFLWNGRSWLRKALEVPLTLWLEAVMSKRRILEIYLNIAEWGPGVYGAEAASRYHFQTTAKNLSPWQAALLAASLPNPEVRTAGSPGPGLTALAAEVEMRMLTRQPQLNCLK